MPEVRRLPDFPEPGDKLSFDDIINNAEQVIDNMTARAQAMIDAGDPNATVGDGVLYELYKRTGYDAQPMVVADDIFDELAEGQTVYFRGITGVRDVDASDLLEALRFGDYYAGYGTFGNGTYASNRPVTGISFGGQQLQNVTRILISPNAKVIDYADIQAEFMAWHKEFGFGGDRMADGATRRLVEDLGRFAVAKGYDAIRASALGTGDETYMVILNRGIMVLPKSNGLGPRVIPRMELEIAYERAVMDDPTIRDQFPHPYSYAKSRGFTAVWNGSGLDDLTIFD